MAVLDHGTTFQMFQYLIHFFQFSALAMNNQETPFQNKFHELMIVTYNLDLMPPQFFYQVIFLFLEPASKLSDTSFPGKLHDLKVVT